MGAAKCTVRGSDYIGAFAAATDSHVFVCSAIDHRSRSVLEKMLGATPIEMSVSGTDLIGLFVKANSNGLVISNLVEEHELERLKSHKLGINIAVIDTGLNALGNNMIVNDKIAIVNPDYDPRSVKLIGDALGVEVVKAEIGGFKTVGANNILTNKGLVINNRATDGQKKELDRLTGFNSVGTTANTGALSIGLSTVANSKGVVVGDGTTGFELARIMEALELND